MHIEHVDVIMEPQACKDFRVRRTPGLTHMCERRHSGDGKVWDWMRVHRENFTSPWDSCHSSGPGSPLQACPGTEIKACPSSVLAFTTVRWDPLAEADFLCPVHTYQNCPVNIIQESHNNVAFRHQHCTLLSAQTVVWQGRICPKSLQLGRFSSQ